MGWGDPDESVTDRNHQGVSVDIDPSLDDVFAVLSDRRRRAVLYLLAESDYQIHTVTNLVDWLVQMEHVTANEEDLRIELRHKHLPKLEATGILAYDPRSEQVVYSGDDEYETVLEWLQKYESQDD